MTDDQKFLDAVEKFGRWFLDQHQDLDNLIKLARLGSVDPKEVVKEVWRLAAQDSDFQGDIEKALIDAFQLVPGSTDLAHFPERQTLLDRWGFAEDDLIFQPFADRPNYKQLHPLLMGMIIELLQYDGDVPELRTGQLPDGGSPAVPVRTMARDPVIIGAMLRTASSEVAGELQAAQQVQDQKIARMLQTLPKDNLGVTGLVRQETERGMGVSGYMSGHRAQFREVAAPSSIELARLPFKERQGLAHKTLTSTQGRRSAVPIIANLVLMALQAKGHAGISLGEPDNSWDPEHVVSDVEWGVQIDGGQGERNPHFNFVDTAAQALSIKLERDLDGHLNQHVPLRLMISPVNTISERRVGWRAVLYFS